MAKSELMEPCRTYAGKSHRHASPLAAALNAASKNGHMSDAEICEIMGISEDEFSLAFSELTTEQKIIYKLSACILGLQSRVDELEEKMEWVACNSDFVQDPDVFVDSHLYDE